MNSLKIFAWLILIVFVVGILIPVIWQLWGFNPHVDLRSYRTEVQQTFPTTEKIVERVVLDQNYSCTKLTGESGSQIVCEEK